MMDRITPAQVRGARGMLDWSMMDLARAAGLSMSTIKRAEMEEPKAVSGDAFLLIQVALERHGASFLPNAGRGGGVRLRSSAA